MEQLSLYTYHLDCGRMGNLMGMFIAPVGLPESLVEQDVSVHWGEVLGKHSDVCDHFDERSFCRMESSQTLVDLMISDLLLFELSEWPGVYSIFGYVPFEQLTPNNDE